MASERVLWTAFGQVPPCHREVQGRIGVGVLMGGDGIFGCTIYNLHAAAIHRIIPFANRVEVLLTLASAVTWL